MTQLKPHEYRRLYFFQDGVTYFNHGGFGVAPRPILQKAAKIREEVNRNPNKFYSWDRLIAVNESRRVLSQVINCRSEDVAFVPNASFGLNAVAREIKLSPGDEILLTDHEYGAVQRMWQMLGAKFGAKVVFANLPLVIHDNEEIVEAIKQNITNKTKVLCFSHCSCISGVIFPVKEISALAKSLNIFSLIDGAHAPGQIPLDIADIGCDAYVGNLHKWWDVPQACGFLWLAPKYQKQFQPLVISWGLDERFLEPNIASGISPFNQEHEWPGTLDLANTLTVKDALLWRQTWPWDKVQRHCHDQLFNLSVNIKEQFKAQVLIENPKMFNQMLGFVLPIASEKAMDLRKVLSSTHKIEVMSLAWKNLAIFRLCYQSYNSPDDEEKLLRALKISISN